MTPPADNIVLRIAKLPPPGPLAADVYEYRVEPMVPLDDGQFRIETIYAVIDAGARGMLDDGYVMKLRVGSRVPTSGIVGRIVESRNPAFPTGGFARALIMRREKYATIDPARHLGVKLVDPADGPLPMHVGTLGMTGFTAWIGIFLKSNPRPGETVLVSAAAGAVGTVAGQLAKACGARVVGIAGGADKCRAVIETFGFDDCVDYKGSHLDGAIAAACPRGVDVFFENVGGEIQRIAFARMNDFGRVAMCGQIAQYSGAAPEPGPNLMQVVNKRLTLAGFLSSDHLGEMPAFERGMIDLIRTGRLVPHATITPGFDRLHEAVNSLTAGRNIGQQLHQMADDPTLM